MTKYLLLGLFLFSIGCDELTREEAQEALAEAQITSQVSALTSSSIEIATNFTIGDAVDSAAAELKTFIETQLPCAAITLSAATLTIEYGANPGLCLYRGQTYAGSHSVSVMANAMNEVIVQHTWTRLRNQTVEVSGSATVTWNGTAVSRRVEHTLEWIRMSDGRTGTGTGDRTQTPLEGGLLTGFQVAGNRSWEGDAGLWNLDIDDVEMRWIDPVPQSGKYTLDTPFAKELSLEFIRTNSTTIQVVVESGKDEFMFDVTTLPDV